MMEVYRSAGYKSPLIKSVFLGISILFLVAVNFFLFSFSFVWFVVFIVLGLLWRGMMRVLTRMFYEFQDDAIVLYLPNKKSMRVEKSEIVSVVKYEGSVPYRRGVGVFSFGETTFCISSFDHLIELRTKKGASYVISPRKIKEGLYSHYTS